MATPTSKSDFPTPKTPTVCILVSLDEARRAVKKSTSDNKPQTFANKLQKINLRVLAWIPWRMELPQSYGRCVPKRNMEKRESTPTGFEPMPLCGRSKCPTICVHLKQYARYRNNSRGAVGYSASGRAMPYPEYGLTVFVRHRSFRKSGADFRAMPDIPRPDAEYPQRPKLFINSCFTENHSRLLIGRYLN